MKTKLLILTKEIGIPLQTIAKYSQLSSVALGHYIRVTTQTLKPEYEEKLQAYINELKNKIDKL